MVSAKYRTPVILRADPKNTGNSSRSAISSDNVSAPNGPNPPSGSASSVPSRYASSRSSRHEAAASVQASGSRSSEKSTQSRLRVLRINASTASLSASLRSILFTNRKTGIRCRSSSFQRVRVCSLIPAVASITSTQASSTARVRSVSAERSTCPGVSRNENSTPPKFRTVCFEKIVMPRSFSCVQVSRLEFFRSTLPGLRTVPLS